MTATTAFGARAGAKATNQASVLLGSGVASAVGRSSAVPVLPATPARGGAAAVPVPERTTESIMSRTGRATRRDTARRRRLGAERTMRGWGWTPRLAIVAPTA